MYIKSAAKVLKKNDIRKNVCHFFSLKMIRLYLFSKRMFIFSLYSF